MRLASSLCDIPRSLRASRSLVPRVFMTFCAGLVEGERADRGRHRQGGVRADISSYT